MWTFASERALSRTALASLAVLVVATAAFYWVQNRFRPGGSRQKDADGPPFALERQPDGKKRAARSLELDPLRQTEKKVRASRKPDGVTVRKLFDGLGRRDEFGEERSMARPLDRSKRVDSAGELPFTHGRASSSGRGRAS